MLDRPLNRWTTYKGHVGIDYPRDAGVPVRASARGRVRWSGRTSTNPNGTHRPGNSERPGSAAGNAKVVVYENGVEMRYCHLISLAGAQEGQWVNRGDIIGYVGSTGLSTGPHLHSEVWVNGRLMTNDDYWRYVNKDHWVGQDGIPSGGGAQPLPEPTPEPTPEPVIEPEEEDDEMKLKGAHYVRKADNERVYLLFNEVSGFYAEHTQVPGQYNNRIAEGWDTGNWAEITEAHAKVIKAALDKTRTRS